MKLILCALSFGLIFSFGTAAEGQQTTPTFSAAPSLATSSTIAGSSVTGTATSSPILLMEDRYSTSTNDMAARVPTEVLFGGLSTAIGLVGNVMLAHAQNGCPCADGDCIEYTRCDYGDAYYIGTGMAAAGLALVPLSITLAGNGNGGDGNFVAALGYGGLGVLGGILTSLPLAAALLEIEGEEAARYSLIASVWLGYLAGSLIGYELSAGVGPDDDTYEIDEPAQFDGSLRLSPSAAPTADLKGLSLGLQGSF